MDEFTIFAPGIGSDQIHITAAINEAGGPAAETIEDVYRKVGSIFGAHGMQILHERVFGTLDFYEHFTNIRKRRTDFASVPFSYIQGKPCSGRGLTGIQVHAVKSVSDVDYWTIYDDGFPCGRGWKHNGTTYVHLTGITGITRNREGRGEQAASLFDNICRILASQSFSSRNVVRTWLYLADILDWYDEFNAIRTKKFREFGLIPTAADQTERNSLYLPASTGVGGRNPFGMSVLGDVLAISGDMQLSVLKGVRQRSAYLYGSAFSRGICVQEKDYRQIFVSGTAAIDQRGNSLYPKNAEAQIEMTMEVVQDLIAEKGATLEDIRSATIYLKRPEDLSVYKKVAARRGLTNLPAVCVTADICRDELLFEMDALAVVD
jgi:enamine deaminase RidA (YjgF/YER057c/UK114 family)